ncbi:MAG: FG-GAP-like repeat-containing protein [Polyangiales bacterium]
MLRGLFLFGVVALGCANTAYRCDPTHACNAGSTCTAAGYCAEPVAATRCASGLRYSASAAAPGTCVPVADAAAPDVTVDAPDDAAPDAKPDAAADAPMDLPPPMDAPPDLPPPMDAPPDLPPPMDAPPDLTVDARPDAIDASPDVAPDAVLDVAADTARADAAPDAPRDVGPDLTTAPDASGPCTVRSLAPLAGTRISSNTLTAVFATTGTVVSGVLQYGPSPGAMTQTAPLSARGTDRLSATITVTGRKVFWRPLVQCGDGSTPRSSTWWTRHRGTASANQGLLGWVPDVSFDGAADVVASATRDMAVPFVRAYVNGASTTPETTPVPSPDDGFGARVAVVPDMNGDGAAEVAVGSCPRDQGTPCTRTVFVYTRSPGGVWSPYTSVAMPPIDSTTPGLLATARFGATLAGVGDLDGDGYGDLLIGAPPNDDADAGAFYVLYGGPSPSLRAGATIGANLTSVPPRRRFGWSAAGVGDLDRDGFPDVVVTSLERVWVYRGTGGRGFLPGEELGLQLTGVSSLGFAAAAAGDVNGDQLADLALARGDDPLLGRVTVVLGRSGVPFAGLGATSSGVYSADGAGNGFGMSVLGAFDYNGDDRDDLAVGVPGGPSPGIVAVWFNGGGLVTQRFEPPVDGTARFGRALGAPGDFDGDGLDDLAVGALDAVAMPAAGTVHRLRGSSMPAQAFVHAVTFRASPNSFGQEIGR